MTEPNMEWDEELKESLKAARASGLFEVYTPVGFGIAYGELEKFIRRIVQRSEQRGYEKGAAEERRRVAGIISRIVKQAVDESPGGRMEVWERTISDFIRLEIAFKSGKEDLPEIIHDTK